MHTEIVEGGNESGKVLHRGVAHVGPAGAVQEEVTGENLRENHDTSHRLRGGHGAFIRTVQSLEVWTLNGVMDTAAWCRDVVGSTKYGVTSKLIVSNPKRLPQFSHYT
ncbi:hypothetical protein Ae201684P_015962 [Aphanomyces euteiches]|uniref:Uncharacterized protein n=1 Tax=Aphanomyces euteiches TaxID=100861 RepID=A0A6G0WA57_9STRA|nr:hypothetical protein Ae201684_017128 [Aphanomyces euteiches]KAH9074064.1 hypothetical protein Ae201684P_015962 [Aphanomyces euteiches]